MSKKYTRHGKGGQFNKRNIDDFRLLDKEADRNQRILDAENNQRRERFSRGQENLNQMRSADVREEQVRKEIIDWRNKEVDFKRESIKQAAETDIQSLQTQIDQTRAAGDRWKNFSQTQVDKFYKLATNLKDYADINKAVNDYRDYKSKDLINPLIKVEELANDKAEKGMAHLRFKALQSGDFDTSDYLGNVHRNNNRYYHQLVVNDIKQNIDVHEEELLQFLDKNKFKLKKEDIHDAYQFRAQELINQSGLPPKSVAALKINDFFNHRANLKYSTTSKNELRLLNDQKYDKALQNLLGTDKVTEENIHHAFMDKIEVLKEGNRDRYINPSAAYQSLFEDLLKHPRYIDDWDLFQNDILSKKTLGNNDKEREPFLLKMPNVILDLRSKWKAKHDQITKDEQYYLSEKDKKDWETISDEVRKGLDGSFDLNDYTDGGGRDKLYQQAASAPAGSIVRNKAHELLGYDPKGNVSFSIDNQLKKAARQHDLEEFMYHFVQLDKSDQKKYREMEAFRKELGSLETAFGVNYQSYIRDTLAKQNIRKISKLQTIDETQHPTAYAAAAGLETKIYSLWDDTGYLKDPLERKKATLEALDKIINNQDSGLLKTTGGVLSGDEEQVVFDSFRYTLDSNLSKDQFQDAYVKLYQKKLKNKKNTEGLTEAVVKSLMESETYKNKIHADLTSISQRMDRGEDNIEYPDIVDALFDGNSELNPGSNVRKKDLADMVLRLGGFQQVFGTDYVDGVQQKSNIKITPRHAIANDLVIDYNNRTGTIPMLRFMRYQQKNKTDPNTTAESVWNLQRTIRYTEPYYTGPSAETAIKDGWNVGVHYNGFTNTFFNIS
tara:strand:+ start:234 stop:2744 length:2511 start_codon:yes stop_codon:yes gene_type:complete